MCSSSNPAVPQFTSLRPWFRISQGSTRPGEQLICVEMLDVVTNKTTDRSCHSWRREPPQTSCRFNRPGLSLPDTRPPAPQTLFLQHNITQWFHFLRKDTQFRHHPSGPSLQTSSVQPRSFDSFFCRAQKRVERIVDVGFLLMETMRSDGSGFALWRVDKAVISAL